MAKPEGKFDDIFYTMCNETGGINGLLDLLFSFMYRKTDFFYECEPGDKMGFPPGKAQIILNQAFKYYQEQHYKNRQPPKDPKAYEQKVKQFKEQMEKQKQQEEIIKQKQQQEQQAKQKQIEEEKIQQQKQKIQGSQNEQKQQQQNPQNQQQQQQQQQSSNEMTPEQVQQIVANSNFNIYNGGKTDKYSWTQSIADVTVEVILPKPVKSKQLKINMDNQQLNIKIDGKEYINGKFHLPIKVDDSIWSIEDGNKLLLTLEKGQESIWKTVLQGDQEIDATKVENKKSLESFDGETQGAIRKLIYDHNQKTKGLPTSDQESQLEMMKKAWNAEGSPFQGQEFDPSRFNFDSNNNINFN